MPGGLESAAFGDLDDDHDLDVLVGQTVNSTSARVNSIHYFKWDPAGSGGLDPVATPLPSTPGVDAVAVADVDGDACNDVVAAGTYGTGMVHLGDGAGNLDGGRDLPQLGYLDPATATRVTMAVDDLTGDGLPDVVIADRALRGDGLPQHLHPFRRPVRRCAAGRPRPRPWSPAAPTAAPATAAAGCPHLHQPRHDAVHRRHPG